MWVCVMSKSCQLGRPIIITTHKRSCRKVMILYLPASNSVHRGSGVSLTETSLDRDRDPLDRDPQTEHLPPPHGQRTPWKESPFMYGKEQMVLILLECFLFAGSLEATYSLNWGAREIWGKSGWKTLAL